MPIYTKKGDKGKTSLGSGIRVWKDSQRVKTYGTIDELNAYLGVTLATLSQEKITNKKGFSSLLTLVQNDLFCIGSYLANPAQKSLLSDLDSHITVFEQRIDEMTETMPQLANFILPGGGVVGAQMQYARTLVRRCERELVALLQTEAVDETVIQYINRLSDLFFTLSRYANFLQKKKEVKWEGGK